MHLIRDEWKLIVYYDMNPYWQGVELFHKYLKHLDQLCTKTNMTSHCDVVLLQLYHGYTELEYYNSILLRQQQISARSRRRRGLINGIGYIAHELFGVLDDRFAEQYQRDIELVRANENNLALLWKNQTTIVEAEYNLLTRMKESMDKQHKMFHHYLNSLEKENNVIRAEVQVISNNNEFALGSIIANNIIDSLKNILNSLLDSITNTYNGQSNIHLLKPEQFRKELNIISNQISRDLSLPIFNIQTDLANIYRLLKMRVRMTKQYFIFEIKIPLISRESYETYKILPVPRQFNKLMITMVPIADYVSINIRKDSYIPLTEEELQKCIQYDTDTKLCPLKGPVFQLQSYDALCLKTEKQAYQNRIRACEPTFYKLSKLNTYLYFCCDECTITIICENQVTPERLSKVGVLSLGNSCILKGERFTLYAQHQFRNELHYRPELPKIEIFPINNIINISLPPLDYLVLNDSIDQGLLKLQGEIKSLKDTGNQAILKNVSYHDIHHYTAIYILMACTAVAAGVWQWWRLRARLWRPRVAPRSSNVVFSVSDVQSESAVQTSEHDTS